MAATIRDGVPAQCMQTDETVQNMDKDAAQHLEAIVPAELDGQRFDRVLAKLFDAYSRSWLQRAIRDGLASVNNHPARPRDPVNEGDHVRVVAIPTPRQDWVGQSIPLNILYQDDDVIVIDKPADLVVHPGAGNHDQTLANALLHHDPGISVVPRAGVVHRLDKDTSGLMVVARNLASHAKLVAALSAHQVTREYYAIVAGRPTAGGTIDAPIGRSRTQRTRMAVTNTGKPARTHYRIAERFRLHTALSVQLETGRTHQIRVHLTHQGFPIIGDATYRGRTQNPRGTGAAVNEAIGELPRQALHAIRLSFAHPATGEDMSFDSPLPAAIVRVRELLREDIEHHGTTE